MVDGKLRAAQAIEYPHQVWVLNDGRIAGKDNWREIDQLARRHGLPCLTREEGARGKAGNLNHGLRYSDAEFVAVIDADHRAEPRLAHALLPYLADPAVAFVTTPQCFETSGGDVLNNEEPFFYGHHQPAKDADNAAFSCGNGVVYRRCALDEIGGFSEWNLVEDLHTSYRLHAAGHKSIYHPRPVTVGTAPTTSAGLAKQRHTWAADSWRILFFDTPLRKPGLTGRQRLHYLYTCTAYFTAIAQTAFWIAPLIYLLLQTPALRGSDADGVYPLFAVPYYAAVFGWLSTFIGLRTAVRTAAQRTFLAPVFILAAFKAAVHRPASTVTEKAVQPRFSLLLMPMILITGLTAAALAYTAHVADKRMTVAMAAAAVTTIVMTGILTAVTPNTHTRRTLRTASVGLTILAVAIFLIRAF